MTHEIYFDAGICSLKIYLQEIEKKLKSNTVSKTELDIIRKEIVQ